jgi:hypothetical protein
MADTLPIFTCIHTSCFSRWQPQSRSAALLYSRDGQKPERKQHRFQTRRICSDLTLGWLRRTCDEFPAAVTPKQYRVYVFNIHIRLIK